MKIKPEKILLIFCGGGTLIFIALAVLGTLLKSRELLKIDLVLWAITFAIACIPFIGFLLFVKLPSLFKEKANKKNLK
jgi:hypothetical protein